MLDPEVSTFELTRRIARITDRSPAILRRAVNATAFYLREETPHELEDQLDRPTPGIRRESNFRVDMSKGRRDGFTSRIRVRGWAQSVLAKLQYGKQDSFNNRPIATRAFDRYGNTVRRARIDKPASRAALLSRTIVDQRGNGDDSGRISEFFIGRLRGRLRSPLGIWQRVRGGDEVRLFTVFEYDRENQQTLELKEFWERKGRRKLRSNIRYWARAFLERESDRLPPDLRP